MSLRDRLRSEEAGAVYVLFVLSIFVLMAMSAFAIDLGWIFLNKSRAQRAADSAALAGVTALPAEPFTAIARAHEFAKINGYDDADANVVVTPMPTADNELRVQIDDDVPTFFMRAFGIDTVHVDVAAKARYISSVRLGNPDNIFGPEPGTPGQNFADVGFWPAITFQYDAKANGDAYATRCTAQHTSGPSEGIACANAPAADNAQWYGQHLGEPDGYWYGIEVPTGTTNLSVEVYDAGFGQGGQAVDDQFYPTETQDIFSPFNEAQRVTIGNAAPGSTFTLTIGGATTLGIPVTVNNGAFLEAELEAAANGITNVAIDPGSLVEDAVLGAFEYTYEIIGPAETDFSVATCDAGTLLSLDGSNPASCTVSTVTDGGSALPATTTFRLYSPDITPFNIRDNEPEPGCQINGTNEVGAGTNYTWTTLCFIANPTPGVYPLRIFSGPGRSWNEFSLRANGLGGEVKLFAVEDLSVASRIEAGKTRFFLAEVDEQYRGLNLVVELFDPGDASGNNSISLVGPDGNIWNQGCDIRTDRNSVGPPSYSEHVGTFAGDCTLNTTRPTHDYQADWVKFTVPLQPYSCPVVAGEPFCWWQIEYNYEGKAGERTTWRASVEGSQVALVYEPEP
ncbi:MAG: pilus assembly protein TadG-related protein [Acidimicrobiia bacterium]|nr:pilus assembly protein TadG-related protein [Acidimicrobiia bacterium]